MTQTKKYAIRCSSYKEAIECRDNNIKYFRPREEYHIIDLDSYTIISYKEAVKMGLLEKSKTTVKDVLIYEAKQKIRDINNNELIEKIIKDMELNHTWKRADDMIWYKNILTKHLSSK